MNPWLRRSNLPELANILVGEERALGAFAVLARIFYVGGGLGWNGNNACAVVAHAGQNMDGSRLAHGDQPMQERGRHQAAVFANCSTFVVFFEEGHAPP